MIRGALVLLLGLGVGCRHLPLAPEGAQCVQAESHPVRTADGATVHLHRHRADGPPVLVVHGISANYRSWDLEPERSLAVALNAAGYDAWLLDMRGHGLAHVDAAGKEQRAGWTISDYGEHDLAAAIGHIKAETGWARVGYVGHSLGGMVAAIYNAAHGDGDLAAVVIVSSPVDFGDPDRLLVLTERMIRAARPMRVVPSTMAGRMASGWSHLPMDAEALLWAEPESIAPDTREVMMESVLSPMTRRELAELRAVLEAGMLPAAAALPSLTVPLRVIVGRGDRVAPPDRVRPYYTLAGSAERSYVLAGRANGFRRDYGHVDILIGEDAPAEIYPLITGWFAGRWE